MAAFFLCSLFSEKHKQLVYKSRMDIIFLGWYRKPLWRSAVVPVLWAPYGRWRHRAANDILWVPQAWLLIGFARGCSWGGDGAYARAERFGPYSTKLYIHTDSHFDQHYNL